MESGHVMLQVDRAWKTAKALIVTMASVMYWEGRILEVVLQTVATTYVL